MEEMREVQLNLSLIQDKRSVFLSVKDLVELHVFLENTLNISNEAYFLKKSGKVVCCDDDLSGCLQVVPRLCGGKGGFGSMLRAIGAQIEKTTNREACRDLSGRRLRDINEEQRLKKWISQQSEREREAEERKKKKLEKLSAEPKFEFTDKNYEAERADLVEKINESVEQGFKASTSKRKSNEPNEIPLKKKKKKLILDFDEDLSSSDESAPEISSERTNSDMVKIE